ncbi:MAG: heterodisulfide reductase-related iron-sulfur binding cluster [Burkholderiaceae bacterium]|nr:heterodisulfide reductase-related iron-sulfur binding cluster [Burkholderiaceae bacterium]
MSIELTLRLIVILAALAWAGVRFWRLARPLFAAPAEGGRLGPFLPRAKGVVVNVFGHARLLRKRYAGSLHLMMFFGFVFLLTAVVQVFGAGFSPLFSLDAIGGSTWIALGQDIFAVLLLVAVTMALVQRLVRAPARFEGSNKSDALIILLLVTAVVVSMLFQHAFQILDGDPSAPWRPVSSGLATGLSALGATNAAASTGATIFAWVHMLAILGFLIYLPGSKHLHIVVAIPNVYMRNLRQTGRLTPVDLEQPRLGLAEIEQLPRKQTLDLYACTECGRCQEMCPAHAAGKPLSPKRLIMDMRDHLLEREKDDADVPLVGGAIKEETIWACTTCGACLEACPLFIEQMPKIVDMRRHLSMEAGRVPDGIAGATLSIEQRGHPWAGTRFSRLDWCRDLDLRILGPGEETETLLWVGCTAALDARAQKVVRSLVRLLRYAGEEFAILGDDERCTGDPARRTGNDYLFQLQATANIETLNARKFNRIVSICPHGVNTFKNEYPDFGGKYEVLHHSELLSMLIREKRLPQIQKEGASTITFHDPCYLGRHMREFDAPRAVLGGAGEAITEMERSREKSFCCGSGGGHAFMVEPPTQRVNLIRAQQARETGASTVATACPFCLLMLDDGCKAEARQSDGKAPLDVRDIAEILDEALMAADFRQGESANVRS